MAGTTKGTQLFIIHTHHKENLEALKKVFPQLSKMKEKDEAIVSYFDKRKRPIVVVNVKDADNITAAFKKMTATKKISPGLSSIKL